ncbi:MAG: tRNA pseudouridine(38-40) synthase TruA [Geminicoccaceae bacterium]
MPRYRLLLEYNGGPFQGWQRQGDGHTVQGAIEAAVLACAGEAVAVVAAGRTDAGVHALGQVAHLDLARTWLPERLTGALNFHLRPAPITVLEAREAAPDFHARFSCTGRRYLYRILDRRSPPALERGRVWHVPVHLDVERMHVAAQALVGRHDFTSFRSSECQSASPVKTLSGIHLAREDEVIECRLWARSFLHHQVRNMVGTLKRVGERKAPIGYIREALLASDRAAAGQTAPAEGLFLEAAEYGSGVARRGS